MTVFDRFTPLTVCFWPIFTLHGLFLTDLHLSWPVLETPSPFTTSFWMSFIFNVHFLTSFQVSSPLYDLLPTLYTLHPTLYTIHPTLYILHPKLYTINLTIYTLHTNLTFYIYMRCSNKMPNIKSCRTHFYIEFV